MVGVRRGAAGGRSLHLTGHVDVVPVDPDAPWSHEPWAGEIADGRVWGRGAGDMKGGLAAYLLAAEALAEACPDLPGDLVFSSVIEEEHGGNGMWSVLRAGYTADATLVGEPTGLDIVHAGTGVVWARLTARGAAGHSAYGGGNGPFDELARAVAALRGLEAAANQPPRDAVFAAVSRLAVRDDRRPDRRRRLDVVGAGRCSRSPSGSGSASGSTPPSCKAGSPRPSRRPRRRSTSRSRRFARAPTATRRDGPLPTLLGRAHETVVGSPPGLTAFTATTDARQVEGALCYGPLAGGLHGADEWVDIASLEQTATVVALTALRWLTRRVAQRRRASWSAATAIRIRPPWTICW